MNVLLDATEICFNVQSNILNLLGILASTDSNFEHHTWREEVPVILKSKICSTAQ